MGVISMDEKRIESIENLLTDLIRIVGNTNAIVEELRDKVDSLDKRMDRLESKMDSLESRMDRLESKMDSLESRMDSLESRMDSLEGKVDFIQKDIGIMKSAVITKEDIRHIDERLDFQVDKLSRQEEDIYRLKRCVGIK